MRPLRQACSSSCYVPAESINLDQLPLSPTFPCLYSSTSVSGLHTSQSAPSISSASRPATTHPQIIYASHVAFPPHRGGPQRGAITISSTGHIDSIHPKFSLRDAKQLALKRNLALVDLSSDATSPIALSPGIIDVHCHISELGRDWEGYHTATRAAAAGGITTLFGMPLNSIPATTTVEALRQEIDAARRIQLMADVGLWGGAVPSNVESPEGVERLKHLLDGGVFGLKAFLAPLPPDAGYETVSPAQLKIAATICGERGKPLLVHSELMTQQEQDDMAEEAYAGKNYGSYEAHVASRPAVWEQDAVEVVCDLSDRCHMHVVHLSDSGCFDIIERAKRRIYETKPRAGNLTVETCPHYLLFDAESLPDGDTRYKCFPPIRSKRNQDELWRRGLIGDNDHSPLIDMIASDHSPCTPDLRMQDTGNVRRAWGGLTGLQYQLPATAMAMYRHAMERGGNKEVVDEQEELNSMLTLLAEWWSAAPSRLAPGLPAFKGTIDVGQQADLCAWDAMQIGKPCEFSAEHHRWKGGGVYADMKLRGRVMATWLKGSKIYDGDLDRFAGDEVEAESSSKTRGSIGSLLLEST